MTQLGHLIRTARERANLTQHQLAVRAGTLQSTVSLWETGHAYPRVAQFLDLREVLDLDLGEMITAVRADSSAGANAAR